MKILLILVAFGAIALIFWQCKSTRYTAENLPQKQICWGTGGGFTGKETSFTLLENGQLFRLSSLNPQLEGLKDVKAKTAKALFAAAENLGLDELNADAPGNLYYFLEIKEEGKSRRLVWGDEKNKPDQKVPDFYRVLQQLIAL